MLPVVRQLKMGMSLDCLDPANTGHWPAADVQQVPKIYESD
jgi:hypothetical protein